MEVRKALGWKTSKAAADHILKLTDVDPLQSLRKDRDEYLEKAAYLYLLGKTVSADFYRKAGEDLNTIIGDPEPELVVMFRVVDAEELFFSDTPIASVEGFNVEE